MSLDDDRFTLIYKQYYRNVVGFVRARGPDLDVEDVVGDIFEAVFKRCEDIPPGKELPWIYSTAAYVLSNRFRQKHKLGQVIDAVRAHVGVDIPVESRDHAGASVERLTLESGLRTLNDPLDRTIFFLAVLHDYEATEIAQILGLNRTRVTMRLRRMDKKLPSVRGAGTAGEQRNDDEPGTRSGERRKP